MFLQRVFVFFLVVQGSMYICSAQNTEFASLQGYYQQVKDHLKSRDQGCANIFLQFEDHLFELESLLSNVQSASRQEEKDMLVKLIEAKIHEIDAFIEEGISFQIVANDRRLNEIYARTRFEPVSMLALGSLVGYIKKVANPTNVIVTVGIVAVLYWMKQQVQDVFIGDALAEIKEKEKEWKAGKKTREKSLATQSKRIENPLAFKNKIKKQIEKVLKRIQAVEDKLPDKARLVQSVVKHLYERKWNKLRIDSRAIKKLEEIVMGLGAVVQAKTCKKYKNYESLLNRLVKKSKDPHKKIASEQRGTQKNFADFLAVQERYVELLNALKTYVSRNVSQSKERLIAEMDALLNCFPILEEDALPVDLRNNLEKIRRMSISSADSRMRTGSVGV